MPHKINKNKKPEFKPLCASCRYSILNLLDEFKILNINSSCKKNEHYKCKDIHEAMDEFIEAFTMWVANSSWDAGDCIK